KHHAAVGARTRHRGAVEQHAAGGGAIETGNDAQQRRLPATRWSQDGDEVVVGDAERDRFEGPSRCRAGASGKYAADVLDAELAHAKLHGNSQRLAALNRKSDTRPIRPMMMMPKMICPVLSSAWLSVIMWPMPDDEPISSATMTYVHAQPSTSRRISAISGAEEGSSTRRMMPLSLAPSV